jgi:hypothetical protein
MRYKYRPWYDGDRLKGYLLQTNRGKVSVIYSEDAWKMHPAQRCVFDVTSIEAMTEYDFTEFFRLQCADMRLGDVQLSDELPDAQERETGKALYAWFHGLFHKEK